MTFLLSIHPMYVSLIFSGHKRFELRRRLPDMTHGDVVWVYETAPSQSIIGHFVVNQLHCSSPRAIWRKTRSFSCVDKEAFDGYFSGCSQAFAIAIREAVRLDRAVKLASIRARWKGFTPPQSFRYVPDDLDLQALTNR